MFALFNADHLRAEAAGQLSLDDALVEVAEQATTVVEPVMPDTWELIPREAITGQGVLGA